MKNIIAKCFVVLTLAGCSGSSTPLAVPNLVNGKYYMAGDITCTKGRSISDSRIMCANDAGEDTGYRDAMTDQQIQMWQYNQQLALQRRAQASADRVALAQAMQQTASSIQQSTPQYVIQPAPQLAPLNMPRSNVVNCISVSDGFYTTCRY